MNLTEDIESLKRKLEALATESDDALTRRYRLRGSALPRTPYWQLRRLAAAGLRLLRRLRLGSAAAWPARLKHVPGNPRARPLLIWAVDTDRDTLREACRGFVSLSTSLPDFAPVLVTDVADFAYFSRLGWLVEYLPAIRGAGEPYDGRKARLIARLYRSAPALPVRAGLLADRCADEIRESIRRW